MGYDLVDILTEPIPKQLYLTGVVTQIVGTNRVAVNVDGTNEIICLFLGNYSPVVNDVVHLLKRGDSYIVIGSSRTGSGSGGGAPGPAGPKGDPGEKWSTGAGAPAAGVGATGDLYLNTTNGDVYDKATGAWVLSGNIRGPQGPQGIQGPVGPTGQAEQWWVANVDPVVATGVNGDLALNAVSGDIFEKQAGAWVKVGNIKGPPGQNTSGDNALLNASFESWTGAGSSSDPNKPDGDIYNWSLFWGSVAPPSRGPVRKGVGRDVTCAEFDVTAGIQTSVNQVFHSEDLVMAPGQSWYFSVYCKSADITKPIQIDVQILTSVNPNPQPFGGTVHITQVIAPSFVASTDWQLYEGTMTVPAGDLYGKMQIRLTGVAPGGQIGSIDLAMAKNLNPAGGSLPAYPSWAPLDGVTTGVPAAGATAVLALPYPGQATPPNGPAQIKALADRLEALLAPLLPDTGWLGPGSAPFVINANWTELSGSRIRKIGNRVRIELALQRAGAALNAAANTGAMAVTVGQFAAGWLPGSSLRMAGAQTGPIIFSLTTAGALATVSYTPGQTIATGSNVLLQAEWLID